MRHYRNPYQQAMMTGQFNPYDYMNQRRQQQNFTPGPQMESAEIPKPVDINPGINNLMKLMKGKPNLDQQWGNQGTPQNPQLASGLDILNMMPQAGYGFARR